MVITTHELQTSDVRHLHCSDPRVADEVEAVNRSLHRLDESVPALCDVAPQGQH
jgi:hypothetical protein